MDRIMRTKADELADFAHGLAVGDIPQGVLTKAKLHIMDLLGVALVASRQDFAQSLFKTVREMGGREEASVIGFGDRLPVPSALLVNGSLAHGLDFDDSHSEAVLHPSASVVPTAIAFGERGRLDGKAVLAGVVAGLEIVTRIGATASNQFHSRGFHATAICGTFAAAATAGKLLGLGAEQISRAMGIAGSQAAGSFEYLSDGSWIKRAHPGWASHSGSFAALMAQNGFTGPRSIFEGRNGLYNAYVGAGHFNIERLTAGLGEQWETLKIVFKPYPCCHFTHACMDAALEIKSESGLAIEEIDSIECRIPEEYVRIVCEPADVKYKPPTPYGARFSLPYAVALVLLQGYAGVDDFSEERIKDPVVLNLAQRVTYTPCAGTGFPLVMPGGVKITTRDARVLEHHVQYTKGSPENPMTWDELTAKFRRNVAGILKDHQVEEAIGLIAKLEEVEDVGRLMNCLSIK